MLKVLFDRPLISAFYFRRGIEGVALKVWVDSQIKTIYQYPIDRFRKHIQPYKSRDSVFILKVHLSFRLFNCTSGIITTHSFMASLEVKIRELTLFFLNISSLTLIQPLSHGS